eukprot:624630-Pelagomonas_calceolata.AAC.3
MDSFGKNNEDGKINDGLTLPCRSKRQPGVRCQFMQREDSPRLVLLQGSKAVPKEALREACEGMLLRRTCAYGVSGGFALAAAAAGAKQVIGEHPKAIFVCYL